MTISLRPATNNDAQAIHRLISAHVGKNRLLPRNLPGIHKTIDNWIVAQADNRLVGCGTLAPYGNDLSEVRSLVVDDTHQGNGLGGKIVRRLLQLSQERGVKTVFTLTTATGFFERQGFVASSRRHFPLKIYRDCLKCPVKFHCDETTMLYKNGRSL